MVRKTLKWLIWAIVVMIILFWLLGGGIQKVIGNAGPFSFSLTDLLTSTSSIASFHLPFEPEMPQVPIPDGSERSEDGQYGRSENYGATPENFGAQPRNGAESPHSGQVVIAQSAAMAQSAAAQYIEISVAPGGSPVDISGWTLQSALFGTIATIPQAASPFIMGRVNAVGSALLYPNGLAVIVTGPSPVGVSFSENICTGYLGTLQPFVPPIPQKCPSPTAEIPRTAENIARLGSTCMDYIATLAPCVFPANPPANLSSACHNEIQTKLSYNGCVAAHRTDAAFSQNGWRIYLAQGKPLWNAKHDVIRLLDGQGRVVSVLNY